MSDDWRAEANQKNQAASRFLQTETDPAGDVVSRTPVHMVVLNRNGAEHLRRLFDSVVEHFDRDGLRVVLVDNASTDHSLEVAASFKESFELQIIRNDENLSFSAANNQGSATARPNDLLLFVNNDIIFESDPLPRMRRLLDDPGIGIVSMNLTYPDHTSPRQPMLQHAGIKFVNQGPTRLHRPVNLGIATGIQDPGVGIEVTPAVTAAVLAVRGSDFRALRGFDEDYVYGFEDVDLCLRVQRDLGLDVVVDHDLNAVHDESATQRKQPNREVQIRRLSNRRHLKRKLGFGIRKERLRSLLLDARTWTDEPLQVGFAVTESGPDAKAGDAFTALELGQALTDEFGWSVRYLERKRGDWYDCRGLHILVAMLQHYDVRRIHHRRPELITVAWLRAYFDVWAKRPWFPDFDLVMSSSEKGRRYLLQTADRSSGLLRIAANLKRFRSGHPRESFRHDVVFTGSRWGVPRGIDAHLDPAAIDGTVGLFGLGWDEHPELKSWAKGFVPYADLPDVYASSRIVVDDSTDPCRPFASLNSRFFDAAASGRPVLSNCVDGVREIFDDAVPTYQNREELTREVNHVLREPDRYHRIARLLEREVAARHGYQHRAHELRNQLIEFVDKRFRIAIKTRVPSPAQRDLYGDYHYAVSLQSALTRLGHSARVDILPDWQTEFHLRDDVVIVLRGLGAYEVDPSHINVMWLISHPEMVDELEFLDYDQVFVASRDHARELKNIPTTRPIEPLLQCTDPRRFYVRSDDTARTDVLFVGNSRGAYRPIVHDAVDADLPLSLYGALWPGLVPETSIAGPGIPNDELHRFYSNCGVLLNDHWPDMRARGYLSNRLFDAAACGACIVTDPVVGLRDVFSDTVLTYETPEELGPLVRGLLSDPERRSRLGRRAKKVVESDHTFESRARVIMDRVGAMAAQRWSGPWMDSPHRSARSHSLRSR